jgi:non-specific serine/threonine protein kinase
LDGVSSLVGKSLLRQEAEAASGGYPEPRFGMLETIREYGLAQLAASGEEIEIRQRHARWCLELVERAWPAFVGRSGQEEWLDRFAAEHDNLRAALRWLEQTGEGETALALAGRLFWFWYVRGYLSEGRDWLERTLPAGSGAAAEIRARALLGVAMLAHWQGDDARARPCLEESLALWRQLDDAWGVTFSLGMLGVVAEDAGEFARAVPLLEEALALARAAHDQPNIALILDHLGVVAWGQGDAERAVPFWEEALALHRVSGDTWGASISLSYLGMVAGQRGEFVAAEALHRESMELRWAMATKEDVAHCLANFAALAAARGQYERATRLFGAADAVQTAIGNTLKEPERTFYEQATATARAGLDERAFSAAWAAGQALRLEEAVAEALAAPESGAASPVEMPSSRTVGSHGLTARELEVLRLLVAGRTDKEIAEDLFISPRTAQGHVGSVYTKLGVNGRAAAVAAALRGGLVADESPPAGAAPD